LLKRKIEIFAINPNTNELRKKYVKWKATAGLPLLLEWLVYSTMAAIKFW
jgi:hypothetical protein